MGSKREKKSKKSSKEVDTIEKLIKIFALALIAPTPKKPNLKFGGGNNNIGSGRSSSYSNSYSNNYSSSGYNSNYNSSGSSGIPGGGFGIGIGIGSSIFGGISGGGFGGGGNYKRSGSHNSKTGGWAAIAFRNIVDAHSSVDDIVDEFGLDKEENSYECDAYEDAYQEQYVIATGLYQDDVDYLLDIADGLTAELNMTIEEADDLIAQAESLREEAESIKEDASSCEDPEDMAEMMEEAEALEEEADDLQAQAEVLQATAMDLETEIDGIYTEIDALTIEDYVDDGEVEKNAFTYACEFAEGWVNGEKWIPSDVLDWAFYEISDHNG